MNFPEKNDDLDFFSSDCILDRPGDSKDIIKDQLDKHSFVLILGIPGIGKTLLAVDYARSRESLRESVFIKCSNDESMKENIDTFLSLIPNPGSLEESLRLFKDRFKATTKKYLFLLDDIRNYEIIKSLMPNDRPKDFRYILTSRNANLEELNKFLNKNLDVSQVLKPKMFDTNMTKEILFSSRVRDRFDDELAEKLISLLKTNEESAKILPKTIHSIIKFITYFEFNDLDELFKNIKSYDYDNKEHALFYDIRSEELDNDKWCFLQKICEKFDGCQFNLNDLKNMGYDQTTLEKYIHDLNNFSFIEEKADTYIQIPMVICEEVRRFIEKNKLEEDEAN